MIRLAVRVRRAQAELVLAELLELAPAGVEEVELDGQTIEYAVYGAPGELPTLPDVTGAAGDALVEISTSETPDDWHERWKSFHSPVLIEGPPGSGDDPSAAPALHLRAPWQPASERADVVEIEIDPGQAFGTGAHPTTRLCLSLMLELAANGHLGGPLLDVGTGSGVLGIAARMLGYEPVLCIDNDPQSVAAAEVNAVRNAVVIDVRRVDLRREPIPWMQEHEMSHPSLVVVANLLAPLLHELAAGLPGPPGHLIAGGLLSEEADELSAKFACRLAMHERRRVVSGDWAALLLSTRDE